MGRATSLGPPAANGTTRVSGRLGQFCAAAVPGKASKASIAPNAGTRAPIARFLLLHMVRSWSCRRGVLECAGHALSFRCDKRAIAKVPPLGFPLPHHIARGVIRHQ